MQSNFQTQIPMRPGSMLGMNPMMQNQGALPGGMNFPQQVRGTMAMPPMQSNPLGMPQKLDKVEVKLRGREHGFYSNMFSKVDPNDEGKVAGKEAVTFFKSSGLPVEKLKEIWTMASSSMTHLTRDEFYIALRLIAYAQNNIEVSLKSIRLDIEVGLPNFDAGRPQQPMSDMNRLNDPPPAFKPEDINSLPSLDDLDINLMNNVTSLVPSMDQRLKMEQQQQQQKFEMQMNKVPPGTWVINPPDRQRFEAFYVKVPKDEIGNISDSEMKIIM